MQKHYFIANQNYGHSSILYTWLIMLGFMNFEQKKKYLTFMKRNNNFLL